MGLPPLPGLSCFPPMPVSGPNGFDFPSSTLYPTQDTNISFASRRNRSRSNSPEQNSFVHSQVWTRSPSPELDSFRSDWCGYSQARTRSPSPNDRARSDQSQYNHARRSPLSDRLSHARQGDEARYEGS